MRKVWRVFPAVLLLMILLTGCGKNPYKEGMEQLKAGQYKEAEVNFKTVSYTHLTLPTN